MFVASSPLIYGIEGLKGKLFAQFIDASYHVDANAMESRVFTIKLMCVCFDLIK